MRWCCWDSNTTPDRQADIGSPHTPAGSHKALSAAADSASSYRKKTGEKDIQLHPAATWKMGLLDRHCEDALFGPEARYEQLSQLEARPDELCWLAREHATGQQVVVRFIRHGSAWISEREILNHRACSHHPHILKLKRVHTTSSHLAVVTEYANLGTLSDFLAVKRKSPRFQAEVETRIRPLFQQLVLAVAFCHARGVSNRSITVESIRLTRNTSLSGRHHAPVLKLWDFELSKDARMESACKTAVGCAEYVAPEVLLNTEYDGAASDMWSLGVVLFVTLTGRFCFQEPGDARLSPPEALQALFHRIIAARFEVPQSLSRPCRHLLRRLLCADVDKRLDCTGVLEHPWFQKGLPEGTVEANQRLAELPLEALTQSAPQTEQEVLAIVHAAMHGA